MVFPKVALPGFKFGEGNALPSFNIGHHERLGFDLSTPNYQMQPIFPSSLRLRRRPEYTVIMLTGRRGKGKTLGMTCMADFQGRRFKEKHLPFQVASNYWMEPADRVHPKLLQALNEFPPWGRNLYICVDEAGALLSSRRSMMQMNVNFAQFVTQIRKRHCDLIMATQFPQWVDITALYQVDLFCEMEAFEGPHRTLHIHVNVWDWWGQWTGRTRKKPWPPQEQDVDWEFTIWNAHTMFSKYMTDQVQPPPWAKNQDQIIDFEWGDKLEEADESMFAEDGKSTIEDPDTTPLMAEIKSGDQWLAHQKGDFSVMGELHAIQRLKHLDPSVEPINNRNLFKVWLEARGWKVTPQWIAEAPG